MFGCFDVETEREDLQWKKKLKKSERIIFEELANLKRIFNESADKVTFHEMEMIADFYRLLDRTDFTKTLWD